MRAAAAVLGTLTVLALGGCTQTTSSSSGDFSGEEKAVADKVADLADDGQRKKAADICDNVLARSLVDQVSAAGSSCATEMRKAIDDADGFTLDVTDVSIASGGTSATAKVEGTDRGEKVTRTFSFVKEDGNWRISGFGQ